MTVLLIIIYFAFLSLGLPDSMLGSAWPSMYETFGVAISSAGIISAIVAAGTIISSLFSEKLIRKLSTRYVTLISVAMTAAALLGISFAGSFWVVCLWAVPLGFGAGTIDAALNNFVALHYKASHMNWLHSFWGIGATAGPAILSFFLIQSGTWKTGYRAVSIIQFALVAILLLSLPLWKKAGAQKMEEPQEQGKSLRVLSLIKLPRAKPALLAFFSYFALECTVGLWGSSYLVMVRDIGKDTAAGWISLYYLGITAGRIISGFLSMKIRPRNMIRLGQLLIAAGIIMLFLPVPNPVIITGLFLIGLGCAPIVPSLLHETPANFGKEHSQGMMGMQMTCAYTGMTLMPPLFGLLGASIGYAALPYYIGILLVVMVLMVMLVYRKKDINSL